MSSMNDVSSYLICYVLDSIQHYSVELTLQRPGVSTLGFDTPHVRLLTQLLAVFLTYNSEERYLRKGNSCQANLLRSMDEITCIQHERPCFKGR